MLEHYEEMLVHYGSEVGARIARKHVAWYSKGLPGSAEFRAAVNQTGRPGAGQGADPRASTSRCWRGRRHDQGALPAARRPSRGRLPMTQPEAAAVLAALADPVIVIDRSGDIRLVNPAAEQFFGVGAAALRGSALADLVAPHSPLLGAGRLGLAQRQHDLGIRHAARRRRASAAAR